MNQAKKNSNSTISDAVKGWVFDKGCEGINQEACD